MRPQLTTQQQRVLNYFRAEIDRGTGSPSLRRAAADLGVSHTAVAQAVRTLEKKGYMQREGRYGRTVHLLNRAMETAGAQRWREIPVIGRVQAGLPMYAQQEWDGSIVIDASVYRGQNLFALRVRGDSMKGVGLLDGDLAICEPRQYARDREVVVALIRGEEATVKRFFLRTDSIELRPENPDFESLRYPFDEILIQGRVVGIQRGPEGIPHGRTRTGRKGKTAQ